MRNVARIKLGYYPLPPAEGSRLRQLLNFPSEPASVARPVCRHRGRAPPAHRRRQRRTLCCRTRCRASAAGENAGIQTIHANLFDVHAKVESFSLLYLNPPYDSEVASFGNKRMEFLFLQRTFRWLVNGGVLVMVVPHGQLQECVPLLAETFTKFQVLRLTDPESDRFDQVALLAVRSRISAAAYETNRQKLIEAIWRNPLPLLAGNEVPYDVPPSPPPRSFIVGCPWTSWRT